MQKKKIESAPSSADFVAPPAGIDEEIKTLLQYLDSAVNDRGVISPWFTQMDLKLKTISVRIENAKLLEMQKQTEVLHHINERLMDMGNTLAKIPGTY